MERNKSWCSLSFPSQVLLAGKEMYLVEPELRHDELPAPPFHFHAELSEVCALDPTPVVEGQDGALLEQGVEASRVVHNRNGAQE